MRWTRPSAPEARKRTRPEREPSELGCAHAQSLQDPAGRPTEGPLPLTLGLLWARSGTTDKRHHGSWEGHSTDALSSLTHFRCHRPISLTDTGRSGRRERPTVHAREHTRPAGFPVLLPRKQTHSARRTIERPGGHGKGKAWGQHRGQTRATILVPLQSKTRKQDHRPRQETAHNRSTGKMSKTGEGEGQVLEP